MSTHFAKKNRFFYRFFARKRIYVALFGIFCQSPAVFFTYRSKKMHKASSRGKTNKKTEDVPMKILILTDQLNVGGAETHIALLAQTLLEHGEEVIVASSGGKTADRLEKIGIPQIRLPLGTHSPLKWLTLRYKIRALIKRKGIEIAHAHARVPASLIHGVKRLGCAEIVTVHAKFKAGVLRRFFSRWGEKSIAVSEDLRTYLHNVYKIPMQRIVVIPNGIDLKHFCKNEQEKERDTFRILFASRLDEDCSLGAELLCEIAPVLAKQLPNLRITIVGGGNKLPEIAERSAKINHVLGFCCVSPVGGVEDMAPLLREHDIFIGVSRAALEAAASCCSVILCGNEGYGGILTVDSFFDASLFNFCARGKDKPRADRLLADILTLVNTPSWREKNALECRRLLEEWYDGTSVCQQTVDVYQKSLHTPRQITVAIGGYFGCGNLGDDAILQAFIEYTRAHYPNILICALTKKPPRDARRFGVHCFNRKNLFSLLYAFGRADAFLCGGGSLLQNVTGKLSLYYYLCMLRLSALCGAKPLLYAAGIGPLYGKRATRATLKTLSQISYISLRDEESLRFLQTQNIDSAKLHLGADVALLLSPPPIFRTYALLKRIDVVQNCRYICVSLKSGRHNVQSIHTLIAALRMFCRQENILPVFLPLDKHDIAINAEAARRLDGRILIADEPSDITAILRGAQFLVSMRLHGLILATTVALPSLGIPSANDPKIPSFARIAAQEYLLPEKISLPLLMEIFQNLYTRGNAMRPLIADACRDLQKNAQKDLANIAAMVYNRGRYEKKSEDRI